MGLAPGRRGNEELYSFRFGQVRADKRVSFRRAGIGKCHNEEVAEIGLHIVRGFSGVPNLVQGAENKIHQDRG